MKIFFNETKFLAAIYIELRGEYLWWQWKESTRRNFVNWFFTRQKSFQAIILNSSAWKLILKDEEL